jgi:MOSC domain-containing protein YiiM
MSTGIRVVISRHMKTGVIKAISISEKRGQLKSEVPRADLLRDHGIENDGHAGPWSRQVTCLDWASVVKANEEHGLKAGPGDFAENILIEGLDLSALSVGSRLRLGESAVLEVTQIGKEDHPSVVSRSFGVSLLPSEGLFCRVIEGGAISKGDPVEVT